MYDVFIYIQTSFSEVFEKIYPTEANKPNITIARSFSILNTFVFEPVSVEVATRVALVTARVSPNVTRNVTRNVSRNVTRNVSRNLK